MKIKFGEEGKIEELDKKNGKTVANSKSWVSPDGNKMMFEFSDSSGTSADPVTGKGEATGVAEGPEGAHLISGSWRMAKMDSVSDNGLAFTYKVDGDSLTMSNPTGQTYTAKLDGTDAPYKGDPGTTSVSLRRADKNTLEETDKRDGKVINVSRMTVATDGTSMNIAFHDTLHGTTPNT